ncbi:MAG: glycosyltransferase family 2 protein [Kiritimatiellia bacterium]
MSLSVTIAARNEEANIARCLDAVKWADEIVVVDDMSTDRTAEICRQHGVMLLQNDSRGGFHANKNLAIERASGDWILTLDADEVVSPELADEIRRAVQSGGFPAYCVNRMNFFLGRWIRGCGWYPDRIIRLFRKGATRWPLQIIADDTPRPPAQGGVGFLEQPLLHYSYVSFDQYLEKFGRYTTLLCRQYESKGRRLRPRAFPYYFVIRPALIFMRKYFWLMGFRDGFRGLFISLSAASAEFVAYAKLWELQYGAAGNPDEACGRTSAGKDAR